MRYLLDTSVIIWHFEDNKPLPKNISGILENTENTFYVSVVSVWEIVVKLCVKKLNLSFTIDYLYRAIKRENMVLLPIKQKHLNANLDLPMLHGDPFDRLLIATAISENMKFITSDKENQLYDVEWVWEK